MVSGRAPFLVLICLTFMSMSLTYCFLTQKSGATLKKKPLNNTGLQKNFLRINFQYSYSFSPAEYEYESHFFPSRLDFPENYDRGLKTWC